jgi:hypothetical protein
MAKAGVEAGSNTYTSALQVVGSDGKKIQCMGIILGPPIRREYKYGDQALQVRGASNLSP